MNYHVIAYRWGDLQEQCFLFSSDTLEDCIAVAEHYPDYRGGKYGCAVYQSPDVYDGMRGDGDETELYYFPSMMGEKTPKYNHRCDVFNSTIIRIMNDPRYKDCPWIDEIITEDEKTADKRNARE